MHFESVKYNQGNIGLSFDSLNVQENADILGTYDESFDKLLPSHLDPAQCSNDPASGTIAANRDA